MNSRTTSESFMLFHNSLLELIKPTKLLIWLFAYVTLQHSGISRTRLLWVDGVDVTREAVLLKPQKENHISIPINVSCLVELGADISMCSPIQTWLTEKLCIFKKPHFTRHGLPLGPKLVRTLTFQGSSCTWVFSLHLMVTFEVKPGFYTNYEVASDFVYPNSYISDFDCRRWFVSKVQIQLIKRYDREIGPIQKEAVLDHTSRHQD